MKYRFNIILWLIFIIVASLVISHLLVTKKEGHSKERVIPLKIYQTWETKDLPEKMRENIERLKSQNPEFEYHLFDDSERREFIKQNFNEEVLNAYNKIVPGAYRADLWRYCVLYINGGVYMDIKYSNVGDFKLIQLTDDEYFVPDLESSGGGVYNAFIICKPRNEILLRAIQNTVKNVHNEYYGESALCPTGPMSLKSGFNNESDIEKMKNNGLGLCRHNDNTSVCLHGTPIITTYDEYYKEDIHKNKQKRYWDLWLDHEIYNK
jgi:mannosyltransferase OCH1-like enzyme